MPSAHISRGMVALAASAVTAVYAAGYVHTQAADSALGDPGPTTTVVSSPSTEMPIVVQPTVAPTSTTAPLVITDQAVESCANEHHVSWDVARTQMKAAGGVESQASPTAIATATTPPAAVTALRPAPTPPVRPTATAVARLAPVAPTATSAPSAASGFKDGTYKGIGTSRRGNIQVSLAVQGGHIASVTITGSTTEYPTRDIAALPGEVVSRQSAQVDSVSGATFSSMAFRGAVQQALQRAQA